MSLAHSPSIVMNGLVLCLDAENRKSYDNTDTNLFVYSEDFSNAAWLKSSTTVTSNATTGPTVNGVILNADKLVETAVTQQFLIYQSPYTPAVVGDINTISVYAKAGERTQLTITSYGEQYAVFNLDTGTIYQTGGYPCSIENVGGGWFRCSTTIQESEISVTAWFIGMWKNNTNSYLGTVGQGLYIAGAQFERGGTTLSAYTKTVATANSASTAFIDISGNSNTGTLSNVVYTGDPAYMNFTSALSSSINLGAKFNYTSESFSFSYWVYLNSYTTSNGAQGPIPFFKGAYQQNGYYNQIQSGGGIGFSTNQAGVTQLSTGGAVPLTTWTNVCITRSGTAVKIYVNGLDATTVSTSHINPASSSEGFRVGSYNQTSGGVFTIYGDMRISNFIGYNTALSPEQVLQNFNALKGRYGV